MPDIRCWKCNKPIDLKDVEWKDIKGEMYAYCKECGI